MNRNPLLLPEKAASVGIPARWCEIITRCKCRGWAANASGVCYECERRLKTVCDCCGELYRDHHFEFRFGCDRQSTCNACSANPYTPPEQFPTDEVDTYYILLSQDGRRRFSVTCPIEVTPQELNRIQAWLSLQLLVMEN